MIKGLIDHWVPSDPNISSFWKYPLEKLFPLLDDVLESTNADHFTFYTKWYTNGIKSSLPFLVNHPQCMNVATDNEWGRRLIDYLHGKGVSVGAMLQCYTFEAGFLPASGVCGSWDQSLATGMPGCVDIVSPAWKDYPRLLAAMIEEHLSLFPGIDAMFLEFEGFSGIDAETAAAKLGIPCDGNNVEITGRPAAMLDEAPFLAKNKQKQWLWTNAAQKLFETALQTNLATAESVFSSRDFKGIKGIVYAALGYELPYVEQCLPNNDWWLIPWKYWGWHNAPPIPRDVLLRQTEYCQNVIKKQMRRGRNVCYIGNATLPTVNPDSIEEMLRFCVETGLGGYIGMGSFIPEIGLQWHGSTPPGIEQSKKIHEQWFREQ